MPMVSKCTPKANFLDKRPGDGAGGVTIVEPAEVVTGTVRCPSWRTYKLGYQVSILRANRQIYREALNIFHLDNFWTLVRVNKAGFGEEMKACGIPVATAGDISRHVKFPVLKVEVTFPSLKEQKQSDSFVMATVHLKHLVRALWTVKGASEIELTIDIQPRRTNKSPAERSLLRPFSKLRSINKITVLGVSNQRHNDRLTGAIMKPTTINQTYAELTAGIKCMQLYIKAGKWRCAIEMAEKHLLLMYDCRTVYGNRFLGFDTGISMHTSMIRGRAAREIMVASAKALGEIALYLGQYNNTVRFACRAINLISRRSIIQVFSPPNPANAAPATVSVVLPPPNPLRSVTNTINYDDRTKSFLHLLLAQGYMGMGKAAVALWNINRARDFVPDSAMLTGVSHAWEVAYGPVPTDLPPFPPPSAPEYASLTSAFADAVEALD